MNRSILLSAWVIAIVGGFCALTAYQQAPSESGESKPHWPSEVGFALDSTTPTLVMFAHPRCPCTRASVHELAVLMAKCQTHIRAYVVLVQPADVGGDWVETDLKRKAEEIPGVVVIVDKGGRWAQRFSVQTSGETLVYDKKGLLRFSGGITSSRGHQGDNFGRQSIVSLALTGTPTQRTAPVFGCPLQNPPSSQKLPSDPKS